MQNSNLQEKSMEEHRQELMCDIEQRRLVVRMQHQQCSLTQRCFGTVGQYLIMLGTRLKELETSRE